MKKQRITCIKCPLGCQIFVDKKGDSLSIVGFECNMGKSYAQQEVKDPRRVLTTTVQVKNADQLLLPVRSEKEIPKNMVKKCVRELSKKIVKPPIKQGDIVQKNILGTKVDIIASCNIEEK